MIVSNLPLVRFISKRIAHRLPVHVDTEDLYEAGVVGLIDAIDKFDPVKNVRFKTYAEYRIRGAILDSLRAQDWVPRSLRRRASRISQAAQTIAQAKGSPATSFQITQFLDMSLESYYRYQQETEVCNMLSLEGSYWENASGEVTTLMDVVPDTDQVHPADTIDYATLRLKLAKEIESLPEKQRMVLYYYYYKELNMREIGDLMQITESRVSQIHAKAVGLLRRRVQKMIEEY